MNKWSQGLVVRKEIRRTQYTDLETKNNRQDQEATLALWKDKTTDKTYASQRKRGS